MNLIRNSKKGFTLVELLIVVVILGILAALLLPRLASQPEKAIIAEGVNMLGAMRRAQITTSDASPGANYIALTTGVTSVASQPWNQIGVNNPNVGAPGVGDPAFNYTCGAGAPNSGVTCQAVRRNRAAETSDYAGSGFTLNIDSGAFAVVAGGANKDYQLSNGRPTT